MATVVGHSVPPLVAGDKLTRAEFLRRWEARPEIKNAELIGGMVYRASPVSAEHSTMETEVGGWLYVYKAATPGTSSGHNATTILLNDMPQPDLNLRILPEFGGRSFVKGRYLNGIPELLAEICGSSTVHDLHVKLELYRAAGVPEYLTVLLFEREIRWHVLVDGQCQLLAPDPDGLLRSRIFPGLWLDGNALLAGNSQRVLEWLQDGLHSPEHSNFVAALAARRAANLPSQ
ncbi:MAG: Uma2 family endonuclease [Gemmataceae bacterium]